MTAMMQTSECGSVDSRLRGKGVRSFRLAGSDWWTSDRILRLAVCGLLLSAVGLVFGQTAGFDFVNYDNGGGVYGNRLVTNNSASAASWRCLPRHMESWAPLTCLSHLLVWHLCGHGPAAHHLTNILLHAAATILLFLVLERMTGRKWPMRWWRPSSPFIRCAGVGGLGDRAERRAQRIFLHADALRLPRLRAPTVFALPLLGRAGLLHHRADSQADGGDAAFSALVIGLLAAGAVERHKAAIVDRAFRRAIVAGDFRCRVRLPSRQRRDQRSRLRRRRDRRSRLRRRRDQRSRLCGGQSWKRSPCWRLLACSACWPSAVRKQGA